MKKLFIILLLLTFCSSVYAAQYTKGHFRKNGTYVNGYYKTKPDSYKFNNYSSGYTNMNKGRSGYKSNSMLNTKSTYSKMLK